MMKLSLQKVFSSARVATRFLLMINLVLSVTLISANANERSKVLDELKRFFGEPLDNDLHLYNLSETFVIQATFDSDLLVTLAIEPKSTFNEKYPDWKETDEFPTISHSEYLELLKNFSQVKPIGSLLLSPSVFIVTNNTAWKGEYFGQAYVDSGHTERGSRVRVLTVNYFRQWTGMVCSKRQVAPDVYEIIMERSEDGRKNRYYVKKQVFDSARVGELHNFEAAFVN